MPALAAPLPPPRELPPLEGGPIEGAAPTHGRGAAGEPASGAPPARDAASRRARENRRPARGAGGGPAGSRRRRAEPAPVAAAEPARRGGPHPAGGAEAARAGGPRPDPRRLPGARHRCAGASTRRPSASRCSPSRRSRSATSSSRRRWPTRPRRSRPCWRAERAGRRATPSALHSRTRQTARRLPSPAALGGRPAHLLPGPRGRRLSALPTGHSRDRSRSRRKHGLKTAGGSSDPCEFSARNPADRVGLGWLRGRRMYRSSQARVERVTRTSGGSG